MHRTIRKKKRNKQCCKHCKLIVIKLGTTNLSDSLNICLKRVIPTAAAEELSIPVGRKDDTMSHIEVLQWSFSNMIVLLCVGTVRKFKSMWEQLEKIIVSNI